MTGKQNARRRVWGKTKGMLFRIFKKSPAFWKLFVICLSATPLTKESMEMRIPPSCSAAALVSLLIPRTKRMYTPCEWGNIIFFIRKNLPKDVCNALSNRTSVDLKFAPLSWRPLGTCSGQITRQQPTENTPRGGDDSERDGKKQTKNQI